MPQHEETRLFEQLSLEGAQAGLAWSTILAKRDHYRRAFAGFEPARVARFGAARIERLAADPGIVRHRGKIAATVGNARAWLAVAERFGSFDRYLWAFVGGRPIQNAWRDASEVPARTPLSEAISRDLVQRGFRFVGPTIVYAFMQASGLVNDHLCGCPRHAALGPRARPGAPG